ncbi:MAG: methyltransferase domain-containing protein, partial [Treponema sp.]|nr:methyltransferase domain-containing protein [Treponema sp.]
MTALEKYYNKFNEDHRLTTRHGLVEFTTSLKYIHDFIPKGSHVNILDLGAGTGRYSVALAEEGHNVTAVELVPRNLAVLESKHANVNCWPGNAMDLHFLPDEKFDITLLFGPLYHLHTEEEMLKAFAEARRVTKK